MNNPIATYRIQFHKDFTLKDLEKSIPYLGKLGVKTIYASPIFAAVPGSTHGYDTVDPLRINPEIGTETQLVKVTEKLKEMGISWLQDIVPNHMAFHPHNTWLMDVLEHGKDSTYFTFFDIHFPTKLPDERLMVPFLGETLEEAIAQKKITVQVKDNRLYIAYGDNLWPVNKHAYTQISPLYKDLRAFKEAIEDGKGLAQLNTLLKEVNDNDKLLKAIVDSQFYRLCHWQETERNLNYRRFFTVNSLICLNMQNPSVFDTYHQYIVSLVKRGIFQGLRIDHVDGLADPKEYLERLRKAVGDDIYIVVEKILAANEEMPQEWPVQGNTGYDFLAMVNNIFTNRAAEKPFNKLYHEVIQKPLKVAEQIILKKRTILFEHMRGELDHLEQLFLEMKLSKEKLSSGVLKAAIADFLIYCPVYRFYGNQFPLAAGEAEDLRQLFDRIPLTKGNEAGIQLLKSLFLSGKKITSKQQQRISTFYQRCMQFSGPLMAKGVEDTLMYTYNRFVGHTEVGDAPDAFGLLPHEYHEKMARRAEKWPLSLNGTSTHDTKRGEDVRARLNVISDIPNRWRKLVLKFRNLISKRNGFPEIHKNDLYLILQSLLGAIPFSSGDEDELKERFSQYIEKALREAKKRSDWAEPNENYENNVKNFATSLLDSHAPGYHLLTEFLDEIADFSIVNSLSQLVLKFTCPGIPDIYQGTELWDLSLVDPDNRRPVDYPLREQMLQDLTEGCTAAELWEERRSGKIKLWLTHELLKYRCDHPELFSEGSYVPLQTKGIYKKNLLAFLRKRGSSCLMVVVPLGLGSISNSSTTSFDWKDTEVLLPPELSNEFFNLLTKEKGQTDLLTGGLKIKRLFGDVPLALVEFKKRSTKRASGILLPVTSMPSGFGIGDFGPDAFEFVDFLAATNQRYWQMLPLNPSTALQSYSPYSAYSAMAGNTLLISPALLSKQNLLSTKDLRSHRIPDGDMVNYRQAEQQKMKLLSLAFQNFNNSRNVQMQAQFSAFCKAEDAWLADFALFTALRNHHQLMPWNEWPEKYKFRDKIALKEFGKYFVKEITEIKWQQFIFHQQWADLKYYANSKGISFIGDLPFYVAYDSVDVWANIKIFKLDEKLNMEVLSGVPPDLFNSEGQIWGMPIFDWQVLKEQDYAWWINRLQKNIALFDLIRLDHFRAFHTYWEIPSADKTARNGKWVAGPAESFFDVVCAKFDELPFIVEDLGGDMDEPIKLREQFNLPGMKVLQFGFGEDMPLSPHLPHNYEHANFVVYTGTHDNNTAKGWYKKELEKSDRKRLNLYLGKKITEQNVNLELIKLALASNANLTIIPFQDILGLGEEARINTPAQVGGNWLWRFEKEQLSEKMNKWLSQQTALFGRK